MTAPRRLLLLPLALLPLALHAQSPLPSNPLAPLAHWIGGEWVGEFDGPGGRKIKVIRDYAWSFDQRLLIGRSWGEADGRRHQIRETHYYWNPESRRIEFLDHLDQAGGHGHGYIEQRDDQIFMNVHVVGNASYPDWRAWIRDSADLQEVKVDTLRGTQWSTAGTTRYRRVR